MSLPYRVLASGNRTRLANPNPCFETGHNYRQIVLYKKIREVYNVQVHRDTDNFTVTSVFNPYALEIGDCKNNLTISLQERFYTV